MSRHLLPMLALLSIVTACSGGGSGGGSASGGSSSGASSSSGSSGSSSGSSGSGAHAFYLPYQATPSSSSGATGLLVVPSNNLGATPVFATDAIDNIIGRLFRISRVGSGTLQSYQPYALVYNTSGAAGGDHLWRLGLDATTAPVPVQMGSAVIPGSGSLCNWYQGQTAADPSTSFFILGISSSFGCQTSTTSYQLVRYLDAATTAPTTLPAGLSQFQAMYNGDGTLAGILALHNGDLVYYHGLDFTNPKTVVVGPYYQFEFVGYPAAPAQTPLPGAPTMGFVALYSGSPTALFRVDNTGAISGDLYDVQPGSVIHHFYGVFNASNAYLVDHSDSIQFGTDQWTVNVLQLPLDATSRAQVLYSTSSQTAPQGTGKPELIGVAGNKLYLTYQPPPTPNFGGGSSSGGSGSSGGSSSGGITYSAVGGVQALTIGTPGTPVPVATIDGALYFVRMLGGQFFLASEPNRSADTAYNTEVFNQDGSVVQPMQANSALVGSTPDTLVQLQGITPGNAAGDFSGGTVYVMPVSSPTSPVPLHTSDGSRLAVPAGTNASACFGGVASGFLAGTFSSLTSTPQPTLQISAFAVDLGGNLVVPISMPDTNIVPVMGGYGC